MAKANSPKIKIASLFSGCGGTDLGASGGFTYLDQHYSKHNVEIVYANDFNKKVCDIFDANFHIKSDCKDLRLVQAKDIPKHDLLIAGFPCQSFSILAQNPPRLGYKDEKGKLFFEIVRILKFHKPKYLICENVKGLMSANEGKIFPMIVKEFEQAGYDIEYKVLNSKFFGVPQKRERVFIVGVRKDLKLQFKFPENILDEKQSIPLSKILERKVDEKYFFSDKAVAGMEASNKKSNYLLNKGRAQDVNGPCNTVTAHLAKVTLNGTDPVLKINNRFRRFTPREVARIQSFPESFKLIGSESAQYLGLGNAVPPVVFWHIMEEILGLDSQVPLKSSKSETRIIKK